MMPKKFDLLSWFRNEDKSRKFNPKLLFLLVIGIALLILSNFYTMNKNSKEVEGAVEVAGDSSEDTTSSVSLETDQNSLEQQYADELKFVLEQMKGVSNVDVVVKLDSTEKQVFEKNYSTINKETTELDSDSGERSITETNDENNVVIIKNGEEEVPVVAETVMPEVKGILVVAEGVDNIVVKEKVIEAVSRGFDVPTHKIAVMAK